MAVGGSWIAPRDLIRERKWEAISERASQASAIVQRVRQS
jgi:2-dehydro-3-deoxyphosphogluconate aldolase/(4S)-4-hydroxy-2-oxoglutarate aldolase